MKVITVCASKGGVGKTSICHSVAFGLANRGFRVLLVDADPQTNLSDFCGINTESDTETLYAVFREAIPARKAIQSISTSGIDLLKGDILLSKADLEFNRIGRETLLKRALKPLQSEYDFALIDTPPALGLLLACSLVSSDYVLIPCNAGRFSLKGVRQLAQFLNEIREDRNPNLTITGIILNRYNPRLTLNRLLMDEVQTAAEELGTALFDTKLRTSVAMDEAQTMQEPIYSGKSALAADFTALTDEFLERIK